MADEQLIKEIQYTQKMLGKWKSSRPIWSFYYAVNDQVLIALCGLYSESMNQPNSLLAKTAKRKTLTHKNRFKVITALSKVKGIKNVK